MFLCLSVGLWRVNGNPNPCTDLNAIMNTHPHLSKDRGLVATPPSSSGPVWGGPETLKAEEHILKTIS